MSIVILPAPRCRRSKRILEYLDAHDIPYRRVDLDSPKGEELGARHDFRASPGILVDGISVNPFDLIVQPGCRLDEERALRLFTGAEK
jgi:glutaredoxin